MITFFVILLLTLSGLSGYLAYKKVLQTETPDIKMFDERVTLLIKLPKISKDSTNNTSTENLFANLHGLLGTDTTGEKEITSFEIVGTPTGLKVYATTSKTNKSFLENQIYAYFPGVQVEEVNDYLNDETLKTRKMSNKYFMLSKKDFFPIKTLKDFETDPLAGIMEVISDYGKTGLAGIQIVIRPETDSWQPKGFEYISELKVNISP